MNVTFAAVVVKDTFKLVAVAVLMCVKPAKERGIALFAFNGRTRQARMKFGMMTQEQKTLRK